LQPRHRKSRLNFLELLRAGRDGYVINEAALAHMREHRLTQAIIARFGDAERRFASRDAFTPDLNSKPRFWGQFFR
jgi:hypothetical protein